MSRRQRTTPEMHLNGDGSASFRVAYDPAWVASVKAMVPAHAREWDAVEKIWFVDEPFVEAVVRLTRRIFGSCSCPGASQNSHGEASDPWQTLHLRPTAPVELIEASYRVLARLHHPDRGGSGDAMQRINGAYSALKERVSA